MVAFDANGNTLSDAQGRSFTWDFENRLTQVVNPGVGTTTFRYDPFGRRIQKSGPLGTTNYLYDGPNLLEEADSSGNVLARYTQAWKADEPFAELRSGTTSYYEQDGLSSVSSLSNAAGALANTYTYDSFGKLIASTGTLVNPFQYTGREFDQETGVYYYRARYIDPSTGRFFSEDPVRFFEGPNFYHYVDNNPLNLTDATGLQVQPPHGLPLGTPQKYWGPFADGFAEALNRLNNTNCAEMFEPSCHEGPYATGANAMQNTTYRFIDLNPRIGAETLEGGETVVINPLGRYFGPQNGTVRLPNGTICNLGSITNVRAFILLHELGHQLSTNTGFTNDKDDAATNSAHSMRIIKSCFQCGN